MMKNDQSKNKYRPLIIIVTIFIIIMIYANYIHHELRRDGALCEGTTMAWAYTRGGLTLKYQFTYQNKKIYSSDPVGKIIGRSEFLNRNFPVMYDPKIGLSQILIQPSDFEKFGLPYPDSLKWVLKYLK